MPHSNPEDEKFQELRVKTQGINRTNRMELTAPGLELKLWNELWKCLHKLLFQLSQVNLIAYQGFKDDFMHKYLGENPMA